MQVVVAALSILWFDDNDISRTVQRVWLRLRPVYRFASKPVSLSVLTVHGVVAFVLGLLAIISLFASFVPIPVPAANMLAGMAPYRISNQYGYVGGDSSPFPSHCVAQVVWQCE